MEEENATKAPVRYNASFTPLRNPARHDKVQATLTDYIADETPDNLNGTKSCIELQLR